MTKYQIFNNEFLIEGYLEDSKLSLQAIGLMTLILDRCIDDFTIDDIKGVDDTKVIIQMALDELVEQGYLVKIQDRKEIVLTRRNFYKVVLPYFLLSLVPQVLVIILYLFMNGGKGYMEFIADSYLIFPIVIGTLLPWIDLIYKTNKKF